MIYQIVNKETGVIVKTLSAQTLEIARMYLEPDQVLYEGGLLAFDRSRFIVQNDTLVEIPHVGPNPEEKPVGVGWVLRDVTKSSSLVPVITESAYAEPD